MRHSIFPWAGLLLAVAPLVAAPVPKELKNKGVDLTGLHARIAERAAAGEWSEDDAAELKKTLDTLLDKASAATGGEPWKLPLALDAAKVNFKKGPVEIVKPGIYLIDGDVTEVETNECIILATGVVKCSCIEDSIVIAKEIHTSVASNSLLVAAEATTVTHLIGHPKYEGRECFVMAGNRIQAKRVCGGVLHLINPEFPADPKGKPPVSAARIEKDPVLLVAPSDREVGDKGFKKVELKAAIAK